MLRELVICIHKQSPFWRQTASVAAASDTFDLSVCFASEPQTIDPALNSAVDGAVMLQHFFEGLMKWADGGNPATDKGNMNYAKLVNGQASSYEKVVNADGTVTYTFKLRPDAKWSDGKDFTACGIVKCEVGDTMGAGESFIAGFLTSWLQGKDTVSCMADGAANAAVTISYCGAW